MIVVYFNERELITCDAADEDRVKADFFKTRDPSRFTRVAVGDYAYVRANAVRVHGVDPSYSAPALLVTTNLSEHKL